MDKDMVSVTLAGPAKIDGKRRPPGATVTVSRGVARDLEARDLLMAGPSFDTGDVKFASDFDAEVKLAVAEALDTRQTEVNDALADLIAAHAGELTAMKVRAEAAEQKAADMEAASAGTADTMAKLESSLSAALSRADAAEAKLATGETSAKTNTQPVPKAGGKKT